MSTTQSSEEGKVLMLDPPEVILKKFKRAVTDSGSEIVAREDKPGVSNLLDILSALTGSDTATLEAGYAGKGYGALKIDVAEAVIEGLRPIQARYAELLEDRAELARLLDRGAERARAIADPVIDEVRERAGLVCIGCGPGSLVDDAALEVVRAVGRALLGVRLRVGRLAVRRRRRERGAHERGDAGPIAVAR